MEFSTMGINFSISAEGIKRVYRRIVAEVYR